MRVTMLMLAVLAGLAAAPAVAADDDVAAGQRIIRSQEEAIGRDDGATAYSFAAPGIQSQFGDADAFMAMVRKSYAPVYRHKSFEFGQARALDGKIAQIVHITDADGIPWEVLYTLERQPDGGLKITSCVLSKLTSA